MEDDIYQRMCIEMKIERGVAYKINMEGFGIIKGGLEIER